MFVGQWLDRIEIWSFGMSLINVEVVEQMTGVLCETEAATPTCFSTSTGRGIPAFSGRREDGGDF